MARSSTTLSGALQAFTPAGYSRGIVAEVRADGSVTCHAPGGPRRVGTCTDQPLVAGMPVSLLAGAKKGTLLLLGS